MVWGTSRYILYSQLVVVALVFLSYPGIGWVGPVSHLDLAECKECHSSQDHPLLQQSRFGNCTSCHSSATTGGLFRVSTQNTLSQEILSAADSKNFDHGMKTPMYFSQTRIGAEPNSMSLIPSGEFIMGTNERLPDEGPEHTVALDAFYIDKYEVTNLQYKKFIDATRHKSPKHFVNRTFPEDKTDHPVTYVNWYDAKEYCEWSGKRLPTDREWEKAARGPDGKTYPWGDKFDIENANMPQRWVTLKREGDTTPVGAFKKGQSVYGLYDMSGNVWEWTSSWYQAYPGNKRITENYGEKYKTLKGGSWWDCSFYKCGLSAPTFNRSFFMRTTRNKSFGFRCAKDAS